MAQTPALMFSAGNVIEHTFSADATAGDIIVLGIVPTVVTHDVDFSENPLGELATSGQWQVPQKAETISVGDPVYWDDDGDPYSGTAGTGAATETAADGDLMGFATAATVATDT